MKLILSVFFILIVLLVFPKNINASTDLLINEVMADPNDGEKEWVELYFPNGSIDISTYKLKDKVGTEKSLATIQSCSDYAVFELNDADGEGWLNNSGMESILVVDGSNIVIDSRTDWESPPEGKTLGRTPEGSDSWNETESPTKCSANSSVKVEVSEPNNNSSSSSPSQSPTTSQSAPKSSPKTSPKTSPKSSPLSSAKTEVLGEKTGTPEAAPSINSFITPPPSTEPSPAESKIANFALGGGAILIVLSLGGYLWYKWEIKKPSKEADKNE